MPLLTKEDKRAILSGVVVGILIRLILEVIGWFIESYYGQTLSILSNYALWVAIPTVIALLYFMVAHHVRKQQTENMPMVGSITRSPDHVIGTYNPRHFGVDWKVEIGSSFRRLNKPYAKANDPYCPKCGYKLDSYTKLSFFGWKNRYYWRCEPCNNLYLRPDASLFRENDVIEKLAMREFSKQR